MLHNVLNNEWTSKRRPTISSYYWLGFKTKTSCSLEGSVLKPYTYEPEISTG